MKKISYMDERRTLSAKDRRPLPVPKETYTEFMKFHGKHGSGQQWYTAQQVIEAGMKALSEQLVA